MQNSTPEIVRRRITVVLDVGGSGKLLLEMLPSLLDEKGDIDLDTVIVEDEAQRRAAELPFVRALCRLTTSEREFGVAEFERAIARRKQNLKKALAAVADRPDVVSSLRIMKGAENLLKKLAAVSNITMFEPLRGFSQDLVPMTIPSARSRRHIVVAINDWSSGTEALMVGALLAKGDAGRISVVLAGGVATTEERVDIRKVSEVLSATPAHIEILTELGIQPLINATLRERAATLVLGATEDLLQSESLTMLREQLRCPICLVRRSIGQAEALASD